MPLASTTEDGDLYLNTVRRTWSAAGLTGVWAEQNTRESIYGAMKRKETFGTSDTRNQVRFYAANTLPATDDPELLMKLQVEATAMGGELSVNQGDRPRFFVWALRDADSAPLQRVQVIKAFVRDGKSQEMVYDAVCADGQVNRSTHRCPESDVKVDLDTCAVDESKGAAELKGVWQDPDFDAAEHALYYVRVLENPVCRWSTWDALRAGVAPRPDLAATIQERAWTSPIWLSPGS